MDFEPFHSSDDEEEINFLKKKDASEKKKKKLKLDKKEKVSFNDIHSPMGSKPKQTVHGVVGPADYIFDQNSPPTHDNKLIPSSTSSTVSINQTTTPTKWTTQQKSGFQQQAFPKPPLAQNSSPMFHPHLNSPNVSMSTKVERPHSSASLLNQEHHVPNSPTPFKQQVSYQNNATPNKLTLLERSKTSAQFQATSLNSPLSSASTNNVLANHQRNQSYSRAMSVPILSTEHSVSLQFQQQQHQQRNESNEVVHNLQNSPIQEVASPTIEKTSSLLHSPVDKENVTVSQEMNSSVPTPEIEEDWAQFSVASSPHESSPESHEYRASYHSRRGSNEVGSLSESMHDSTSSLESDSDMSVWKINEEQREYYTNQFQQLQPNIHDIIKGPQARDFFLKSNLPTEILSKIWRLSDLDSDHALNLQEFSIAMHLVVAVRHGVELPQELPYSLLHHNTTIEQIEEDNVFPNESTAVIEEKSNCIERTSWSADFNGNKNVLSTQAVPSLKDTIQTSAQPTSTSSSCSAEVREHPVSSQHGPEEVSSQYNHVVSSQCVLPTANLRDSTDNTVSVLSEPCSTSEVNMEKFPQGRHSSISSNDSVIARPRAQPNKNVNLMDASPWQLLPPPSSKPSKQKVKKSLTLDGVICSKEYVLQREDSSEDLDTLVSIDRSADLDDLGVSELQDDIQRLYIRKNIGQRGMSKEKSRSIDSLRSDISESSEFHWKRTSKLEVRPRSLTGDSVSDQSMQEKEFEIPPTPPPRVKGHVRSSSLDWNHLFTTNKTSSQSVPDLPNVKTSDTNLKAVQSKPQKPPRINIPKQPKTDLQPRIGILTKQRRALSDHALEKLSEGVHDVDRTSISSDCADSKEGLEVRFSDELEYMNNNSKSPIEIQMRKNELQERIATLKAKNVVLEKLGKELHIQYKNVCQERIQLSGQISDIERTLNDI